MKITFKQMLSESKTSSYLDEVQKYLDAGEIMKPVFEKLKYDINHMLYKLGDEYVRKNLLSIDYDKRQNMDDFDAVYYGFPRSLNELLSFRNKLKKIKKEFPNSTLVSDAEKYMLEHVALAEKMKELKNKIVTVSQKREVIKKEKEVIKQKQFADASSLVNTLLEFIDEYCERAFKIAGEQYDNSMKQLEEKNWDLDLFAPEPNSKMSRAAYQSANRKRYYFMSLTDKGEGEGIRKPSATKKKKFQDDSKKAAHDDYMAWIYKMTDKIGRPVIKSKIVGDPWTGSKLYVTTDDNKEQVWKTQMIINRSKYDKLFNQFPSRKV